MSLLQKSSPKQTIVQVEGLKYVGFTACRLRAGEKVEFRFPEREMCIVVLEGKASIRSDGHEWLNVGERESAFDDVAPAAVYLPLGFAASIEGSSNCVIGVCSAPAISKREPRLLSPTTMAKSIRGVGSNTRYVRDILPQTEEADSLLVVEVKTPAGHSSSYPPHKHDTENLPHESFLEEIYYHRINPPQGFVFQRVYTDDRSIDESHALENHDVMKVPRGYHPVVVPYGYESYYLNVMAGPKRVWSFKNDPAHEWMIQK